MVIPGPWQPAARLVDAQGSPAEQVAIHTDDRLTGCFGIQLDEAEAP